MRLSLPQPDDYIDIHVHEGKPSSGIFIVESLMAHEKHSPENIPGVAYTFGIHPWFLDEKNQADQIRSVENLIDHTGIIAVGEAGFDKLRGPSAELQRKVFEKQVGLAETYRKPVIIHCVKAWDDLLAARKKMKPTTPWMIHGFRGSVELAAQLLSKGLYLSVWFEFALRDESAELIKSLPADRFFLETDGAEVDIRDIYQKVSRDIDMNVEVLKTTIYKNFLNFFNIKALHTL